MREFSDKEKEIIQRLIQGASLSHLFSDDFREHVKILLDFIPEPTRIIKYSFASDKYTSNQISDTLVDTIELLKYLDTNGLVRKLLQPVDSMQDHTEKETFSLGDFVGSKQSTITIKDDSSYHHNLGYLAEFIRDYENTIFKATEPLRSFVNHDFQTLEERMHNQSIAESRLANEIALNTSSRANKISLSIAIFTVLLGTLTLVLTYFQNKKSGEETNANIQLISKHLKAIIKADKDDSLTQQLNNSRIESLEKRNAKMDSIRLYQMKMRLQRSAYKHKKK